MPRRVSTKRLGEGALCRALIKHIRPTAAVKAAFPNSLPTARLEDLLAIRREQKTRRGLTYDAVFFSSESIIDVELSVAKRYITVIEEGPPDLLWNESGEQAPVIEGAVSLHVPVEIDQGIFSLTGTAEDIALVRNQGFDVDDDNEPVEENIPATDAPVPANNGLYEGQSWGWDGFDQRTNKGGYEEPTFTNYWTPSNKSHLQLFLHAFPHTWLTNVLLPRTKATMKTESPNCTDLTLGELLRFIGIRLLMATCIGWRASDFWSTTTEPYNQEDNRCPYNLKCYMSYRRFLLINKSLSYTDVAAPTYTDKFWQMRQLLAAFNSNMATIFLSSWVICLDESMSIWHNKFTCPGWVYCPRKPHPYGNEYHTACCGKSMILFSLELVEGSAHPPQVPTQFDDCGGKTVGLLLRMLKTYFATGKYVVLDSGFCVLKGIIELKKRGLFACALIKKRRYWPTLVPGDAMQQHFDGMEVGAVDAISGELDGIPYNLWGMKEPDYVMRMMATGGALLPDETHKDAVRSWKVGGTDQHVTFKYTKPVAWHFKYRHAVDDHNNLRHALPSLEDAWKTTRWENRVFSFVLAVCEVNSYLFLRYFLFDDGTKDGAPLFLDFRRKLAWELIQNEWIMRHEADTIFPISDEHKLERAPPHARKFRNRQWVCDAKAKYQQYMCSTHCGTKIRTFCKCSPGVWICSDCHVKHVLDAQGGA